MRRPVNVSLFRILLVAGLELALVSVTVAYKHATAEEALDHIDFGARQTSGATFYAAPKKLFKEQSISREDVIAHLERIGFHKAEVANTPGSYVEGGAGGIVITPRLPEFQPLSIRFTGGRVRSLQVSRTLMSTTEGEVEEASIEPEPLGSFVSSITGEKQDKMFVRRIPVQPSDLQGTHLYYAIQASEDALFLTHNGTRFDRIARAILPGGIGGGSSITAQVIKNAVSLDQTRGLARKLNEVFLASSLEARMSKEEILAVYANHVFLGGDGGHGALFYGFASAARAYFGRDRLNQLTLEEAATLVALLPKPNSFIGQTRKGDTSSLARARNLVLERMAEVWPERYTKETVHAAERSEVALSIGEQRLTGLDLLSKAFVQYAGGRDPLSGLNGLPVTQYAGLHVYTSVDPDLMRAAQRILDSSLPRIQKMFPPVARPGSDPDRLLGAIVAVDPKSGEILVMSGSGGGAQGLEYAWSALNAQARPASTEKPILVLQGIAGAGASQAPYTAATIVDKGRVREKLAVSSEALAERTMAHIGLSAAASFYRKLTGVPLEKPSAKLAIGLDGGMEVSPLRWARAYSVLASGALHEFRPVTRAYVDGHPVQMRFEEPTQVVDPGAAFITAQVMRSTLGFGPDGARGTGRAAFERTGLDVRQISIGGKTGSGPDAVWMMSVSPRMVVSVLLTYQAHSQIVGAEQLFAAGTAARVWADFIKSVHKYRPDLLGGQFQQPATVVVASVNPKTGCRSAGSGTIHEFFLVGTVPPDCR